MPEAEFIVQMKGMDYVLELDSIDEGTAPTHLAWRSSDFMEPPVAVQLALWEHLLTNDLPAFIDALGRDRLRAAAACLNNQDVPSVALKMIEVFLEDHVDDQWALAVLCSVLRKHGRPDEALRRTNPPRHQSAALATSRAAAWCDLGNETMARKEADKAMAISRGRASQELIGVYKRIKEGRGRPPEHQTPAP